MLRPRLMLLLCPLAALLLTAPLLAAQQRGSERPSRELRLPQGTSRLQPEERLRAVSIAEASIDDAELRTDERLYLVSVHWFHDKNSSDLKAQVTHYRTDGDLSIVHRVNLSSGRVEHLHQASDKATSLSREEFDIARDLALADERVQAALGKRSGLEVEPMVVRGGTKDEKGRGHRLVRMLFKDGRDYLHRPVVFVDLTDGTVLIEEKDPDAPQ